MIDLGVIAHTCICGSIAWKPEWVIFDDYEIAAYSLKMECVECGSLAVTPTEVDRPPGDMVTS